MIYVMSDIHGRDDLLQKILEKINFDESKDFLYVLGDVIDVGGNLDALYRIKSMVERGCCELIMGNHEVYLLSILLEGFHNASELLHQLSEKRTRDSLKKALSKENGILSVLCRLSLTGESLFNDPMFFQKIAKSLKQINQIYTMRWGRSLESLNELDKIQLEELKKFLKSLPLKKEITLNDRKYILVHGGYDFSKSDDVVYMLNVRENFYLNNINEPDVTVIFGHTTTLNIKAEKYGSIEVPYTIWKDESGDKIGIDCGAAYPNGQLACLCLDDMREFYVKNERNMVYTFDYRNKQIEILKAYERQINSDFPNAEKIIKDNNSKIDFLKDLFVQ